MKDDVTPGTPSPAPATLTYAGPRKETPWQPDRPNDGLPERDPKRYVVVGEHGRGGLGRVLEAYDSDLERTVAVKELLEPSNRAEARFVREAKITARLEHPGIVPVHDAGRWPNGSPFYSMKLVSGRPLRDVLAERKTLSERLPLIPNVLAIAEAIAYAHSKRIIHRDLKPSNVIIGEFGETVVIDWGLAKDLSLEVPEPDVDVGPYRYPHSDDVTVAGDVIGTPGYMPPEQARGEPVDERADIYALGAILYHVLVGEAPYSGSTSDEILNSLLSSPPVRVTERVPGTPADLAAIVDKAMARDPSARYTRAAELAADLKRFQSGQLVSAHLYTPRELVRRWLRRYRVPVAIAAVAAVVLVVSGTIAVHRVIAARNEARARALEVQWQLASSYFDHGRRALLGADYYAALVYLNEALQLGYDTPASHLLFSLAAAPFESLIARLPHGGPVWWADWSPDGAQFVTASEDGTVTIWDGTSGVKRHQLSCHEGGAFRAWFDSTGSRVVSVGRDGLACVWDARAGILVASLQGHRLGLPFATFSPDDTTLLTVGTDGTARVWDLATQAAVAVLRPGVGPLVGGRFLPEDHVLTIGVYGAAVYDLRTGVKVRDVDFGGREAAGPGLVTSDGNTSVIRVGTRLAIWDLRSGQLRFTADQHKGVIFDVIFSADERAVITASEDRTAALWDLRSLRRTQAYVGHEGMVNMVRVIAGERSIVTSGWDGVVRLYEETTGNARIIIPAHSEPVSGVFPSPDGKRLVTTSWDRSAKLWDLQSRRSAPEALRAPAQVKAIDSSSNGAILALLHDGTAVRWQAKSWGKGSGATLTTTRLQCPGGLWAARFVPDGETIVGAAADNRVCVWRAAEDGQPLVMQLPWAIGSIAPGPNGQFVAVHQRGDLLGLWRVGTSSPVWEKEWNQGSHAALSPSGAHFATVGDEYLRTWQLASGEPEGSVRAHSNASVFVTFSPTGQHLLTGGFDSIVRLWSADDLTIEAELRGKGGWLDHAQFDRTRPFVTTSIATESVVWDIDSAKCGLSAAMDPGFPKPFPPGFLPPHDRDQLPDPPFRCPALAAEDFTPGSLGLSRLRYDSPSTTRS